MEKIKNILQKITKKKVYLFLDENKCNIKAKGNISALTDQDKIDISNYKNQIIELLLRKRKLKGINYNSIEKILEYESYSISDAQRRIWVLSQFEEATIAYHMPFHIDINGALDLDKVKQSIASLIDRHEILRTVFRENSEGEVRQWVLDREFFNFEVKELDFSQEKDCEKRIREYFVRDNMLAFDLEQGPLLRVSIIKMPNRYVFYYNMHHIISDGWSIEVLLKDFMAYYESHISGIEVTLPKLQIQYKDYSAWQLKELLSASSAVHRAYWLDSLSGELPLLNFPSHQLRPKIKTYKGNRLRTCLSSSQTSNLKRFSQESGGSLFMGLLAVWNVLCYRYTGLEDIIIGSPVAGRDHPDIENQIGCYVNTLALRNRVNSEEDFNMFFDRLKDRTLNAYSHQMYPFDRLVAELDLHRDISRSTVFDVMLTLQNIGENSRGRLISDEEANKIYDISGEISKFDMNLTFREEGDYLSFEITYNSDIYNQSMVERLMRHYKQLLNALLSNPSEKLGKVEYLGKEEQTELLYTFNTTKVDYPKDKTIVDLFEEQVEKTPDAIAVVFEEIELTYKELNEKSNQLADYLRRDYDISSDDLVGVKLDRSEWLIISIIGVLKAGGAYVPIDVEYPQKRINYLEQDSNCKVIIDELLLAKFKENQILYSLNLVRPDIKSNNLAYVIYTSGSTGEPKGVMIEHKSVANLIYFQTEYFKIQSSDSFLLFSSISFDASVEQLFLPLLNGAKLNIPLKTEILNEEIFRDFLQKNKITHLHAVPSFLRMLSSSSFLNLKRIISGGDIFDASIFREWEPQVSVFNKYGLTETTVTSIEYLIKEDKTMNSLIGKPIANTSIYILGSYNELLPIGVTGEICIAGDGLARGYLNRPELTAEKFISNPFNKGERFYKTGDLGRWLSDGNIEFMGRSDDQVKIRGHRIELGELKYVLCNYEGIKDVIVLERRDLSKDKELVVYFTSKLKITVRELRNYLKERVPDYMLPAEYIYLEEFPLTDNGKIDKKRLLTKQVAGLTRGTEYIAPRNELEESLILIWQEVLNRENIGVQDNFYDLGGDSIKSIQVVSRLRGYGYVIKVEDVLRNPIIEDLVKIAKVSSRIIDQSEEKGEVFLTPIQHSFFKDNDILSKHHYNQSVLLYSKSSLNHSKFISCLEYITNHHDALRMVYKQEDRLWKQYNLDFISGKFYEFNFYDLTESDDSLLLMGRHCEVIQESIDLTKGPLFKVALFRLLDGDRLFLMVHHLVIDGVSWRILLEDLATLYLQRIEGSPLSLPLKTDSFRNWSITLKEYAFGEKLIKERSYWENVQSGEFIDLPKDEINEIYAQNDHSEFSFSLDKETTELLQTQVNRVFNTEINDILLTALGQSINDVFGISKVFVKMEGHGRENIDTDIDITRTVGWFTSVYPYLLKILPEGDILESLVSVKEDLRKIPNKGIGYGILKEMGSGFSTDISPNIVFNYLGDFGLGIGSKESKQSPLFHYVSEYKGSNNSSDNVKKNLLNVSGMLVSGVLNISISYPKRAYKEDTISRLISKYKDNLEQLIGRLSVNNIRYLTPSDLTYKNLSIKELSILNINGDVEDVYKLSPLQEGIYYHWLSDPKSTMYFEQTSYVIKGNDIDIKIIKKSYDLLTLRHGILRTSFSTDYGGEALQIVRNEVESTFVYESIASGLSKDEQKDYLVSYKEADRKKGFDLSTGSQMRLIILDLENGQYQFIWSHHHILTDGWCMSILINDFYKLMFSVQYCSDPDLEPVIPYSNYIKWLSNIDKQSSLNYWKEYLNSYESVLEIPFGLLKENDVYSYKEGKEYLYIENTLWNSINRLCIQMNITQNTFIQGVWGYLLSQYNNINDVVFGSVVSGRPSDLEGVENIIGLFINTIPVRVQYSEKDSAKKLLKMIQKNAISSMPHHYITLSELQSLSEPGAYLLNHVMTFENYNIQESSIIDSTESSNFSVMSRELFEQTNYDFALQITPTAHDLRISFTYNSISYSEQGISKLKKHLFNVINAFVTNPNQALGKLNYLTTEEQTDLLNNFNVANIIDLSEKTIMDLFEGQVVKTPDKVAVVFEGEQFTYRELNEKSNQLAHYLQKQGVKPESLVGICVERSLDMIVGLLGILKAGGAYVPIDPSYPQERMSYMLEDAGCDIVLAQERLELPKTDSRVICLDTDWEKIEKEFHGNVKSGAKSDNLAYVIYTSGSTGKPKGILTNHYSIYRIAKSPRYIEISENDNILQLSNFAFDGSVFDIYAALLNGAKLVLLKKDVVVDIEQLVNTIVSQEISIFFVTTALFNTIVDYNVGSLKNIRKILFGGEQVSYRHVNDAYKMLGSGKIIHVYGPTESTVFASYYEILKTYSTTIPIGKPIANTHIYILDKTQRLVPIGIVGELCISGASLARGYLNRPKLTAEKFIKNPFNDDPNSRLYRTGDLARYLPDGNIEFIGRKDNQVKLRGYRIELGEVEHALQGYAQVSSCVVDIRESSSGDKSLVAYFTGEDGVTVQELRGHLSSLLPSYMVPDYFVKLENLPLTSNGKLDRKSLPDPEGLGIGTGIEYVAPRNEIEESLVEIWSDVLGVPEGEISTTANFFELGGHSLKVLKLSSRLYKGLGSRVSVQDLFIHKSISSQAIFISESEKEGYQEIPKAEHVGGYELSSSQRRLWVLSQFESANVAYNMSSVHELGLVDKEVLESTFNILLNRHESLRTVFRESEEGEVRQFILEEVCFEIDYEDLEGIGSSGLRDRISAYSNRSFDLSIGPLLRGILYRLSKEQYVFVYVMHHIISDGISMDTLYSELTSIYSSIERGSSLELPPLRIHYKDYAVWQQAELKRGALSASRDYWLDQFIGELPVLDLPTDYPRPIIRSYKGGMVNRVFNEYSSSKFKGLLKAEEGVMPFMGVLSLVNVLLYKYTGSKDIILGSPISGRNHPDLEGQIGFYVNTLAFRIGIDPKASFTELLLRVKNICSGGYSHQTYPFDSLVDELSLLRDTSRHPLFDVMVTYQGVDGEASKINYESSIDKLHVVSKFDLTFNFVDQGDALGIGIEYSRDLFNESTAVRMLDHLEELLGSIVSNPEVTLSSLSYLSQEERSILLEEFNATGTEYPKEKTIVGLFEEQVLNNPMGIALFYEGEEMSYAELNCKSNQLARYLHSNYRIERDTLIGVKMDRSLDMIVSILGILKSGGAYVPIDPSYPDERISYMLSDSMCEVVIDEAFYEFFERERFSYGKDNLGLNIGNDDLAYVIYTSGSTGRPKGVMVEHKSVNSFLAWGSKEFKELAYDKMLFVTSICFDLSIFEMFYPLVIGKKIEILENGLSISAHLKTVDRLMINTVPSVVAGLLSEDLDLSNVVAINMAGEPIPVKTIERLQTLVPTMVLRNLYGPSEYTTYSTVYRIGLSEDVSIGNPIDNTQIYIIDEGLSLQAIGVVGEICISGDGLARGYLNRPELTKERFVSHPFREGERLYKTGDLGRWLSNGTIEFIGRKDDQVKIHGYRIELGEVEYALQQSKGVENCCVVSKEFTSGEKELVAYFVGDSNLTIVGLRNDLSEQLPIYMIPSYFVPLDELPLTSNGKLDKKALPDPEGLGLESGIAYVAPRNETEESLVEIWSEVLGIPSEEISIHANFFDLGGHSLKVVKLLERINQVFEEKLKIEELFYMAKLKSQAKLINGVNTEDNTLFNNTLNVSSTEKKRGGAAKLETIKIFAIPFAGGNEYSFSEYKKFCPDEFEFVTVNLPGRGKRIKEKRLESLYDLRDDVFSEIKFFLDEPYVLYGHSMGAILVALLTEKIQQHNLPLPVTLFVSGSSGPVTRNKLFKNHLIPDDKFLQRLYKVGGYSEKMFKTKELLDYSLPILKSDFKAVDTYIYEGIEKLNVPIHVMIGKEEGLKLNVSKPWQEITNFKVHVYEFKGNHFFIYDHAEAILALIKDKVSFKEKEDKNEKRE